MAVVASGCGDDLAADAAAGAAPAAVTPTPGTTVSGGGATGSSMLEEPGMNDISGSQAGSGVSVKISSRTPKAFVAANCVRPIIVVLHQPTSILDQELLKEVRTAVKKTKDELLLIYTPSMVREYGDLPSKLGLFSAPGVAIVGRDGAIENIWSGVYIDNKLIEASLRNASADTACKVAEGTAAGAGAAASPTNSLQGAAALVAGGSAPATSSSAVPGAATVPGATTGAATGLPTTTAGAATGTAIDPTTGVAAGSVPGATAGAVPGSTAGGLPATVPGATGTGAAPVATGGGR